MIRSAPSASGTRWPFSLLARSIALAVVAGTLLAILGPFGSYMNGGAMRLLVYWIGAMLLGLVLYGSAYRLVGIRAARGSPGWWLGLVAAGLVASVPEAFATRAAAFQLWPGLAKVHLPLPLWFAQTAMIGLTAMSAIGLAERRSASASIGTPAPAPFTEPIVAPLGGDVLALQMEDHYVRVHRPAGTELILMPLGRAIRSHARAGATDASVVVGREPCRGSHRGQRSLHARSIVERRGRTRRQVRGRPSKDSRLAR